MDGDFRSLNSIFWVFFALTVFLLIWRRHKKPNPGDQAQSIDDARQFVTAILARLTRIQVAFLNRSFSDETQAKTWLHDALPAAFKGENDRLYADLEQVRQGNRPPAVELAARVFDHQQHLRSLRPALSELIKNYSGYDVAKASVFVLTENIDIERDDKPEVVQMVSIDLQQNTIFANVDYVCITQNLTGDETMVTKMPLSEFKTLFSTMIRPCINREQGDTVAYLFSPPGEDQEMQRKSEHLKTRPLPSGFIVPIEEDRHHSN